MISEKEKAHEIANDLKDDLDAERRFAEARCSTPLQYHYGPTEQDKDPGKMWCYDCKGEVMWLYDDKPHGSYVCTKCSRTAEE